jgi:IPT/TIG domain
MAQTSILTLMYLVASVPVGHSPAKSPVISSISPTSGPTHVPLTINGDHFGQPENPGTVMFGTVHAKATIWTDTQIVVMVPDDAVTGVVQVALPDGTKTDGQSPVFTVIPDDVFAKKIRAGDTEAIAAAGKSGKRVFLPVLQQLASSKKDKRVTWQTMIALAQLGQTEQLQEIWCRAITDRPNQGLQTPVEELELVGGWFGIRALQQILTSPQLIHVHTPAKADKYSDVISPSAQKRALLALTRLIPDSSIRSIAIDFEIHPQQLIRIWQDWIAAHKDELSKLEPTGQGVDFSDKAVDFSDKACKGGKPRKKR